MNTLPVDCYLQIPDANFKFEQPLLADGMRLSESCITKRVLQYAFPDDDRFFPFPEGVATLGHMLAQVWAYQAFKGSATTELPIAWAPGEHTHLDVIDPDGSAWYEIKTSSQKNPTPSKDNMSQVHRQVCAARCAGKLDGARGKIVIINKITGWVSGTWTIPEPTESDLRAFEVEVSRCLDFATRVADDASYADSDEFLTHCTCGQCRVVEPTELTPDLADLLDYNYHDLQPVLVELSEMKKDLDKIKEELKARLQPGKYTSGLYKVSLSDAGRLTITAKNTRVAA